MHLVKKEKREKIEEMEGQKLMALLREFSSQLRSRNIRKVEMDTAYKIL